MLSLIIPAYNESGKIVSDLEGAEEFLSAQPFDSEVIVVDDGSRDDTAEKVRRFVSRSTEKVAFRLESYGANRGKGYAVRFGVEKAQGDYIAFMDSGLCVPLRYLLDGIDRISSGADFAIASRRVKGSVIRRSQPLHRRAGSKAFWFFIQAWLGVTFTDTQCGFKIYTAEAAKSIFRRLKIDGFMFDIEALVVARRLGLKGVEFPVEWSNDTDTRYDPVWGTLRNLKELVRIKREAEA